MESKITLLLFVFLAFCLVGNGLYAQVIGIIAQNKGNPDDRIVEGRFSGMLNLFKVFMGVARGIQTSRITSLVPIDIGISVSGNQYFFLRNVVGFDVGTERECYKCENKQLI